VPSVAPARLPGLAGRVVLAAAGALVAVVLPGCSGSGTRSPAGINSTPASSGATGASPDTTGPAPVTAAPRPEPAATTATSPARVAAASRTTTPPTTDPGALPQTAELPAATDPLFQARVHDLWRAVVDGNPTEALPFFFPLRAYIQVKGISDPVHDYQTRLIPNFEQDVQSLHALLGGAGGSASYVSVSVPHAAQWIVPGVEYNKGSYWRVYGTTVTYRAGGRIRSFPITSMISWRGEWYVVHLGAIR
jgi:hypothetical protein